jgi:Tfp pilus assembly protein PilO
MKKHLSLFVTAGAGALALAYVMLVFLPGQKRITALREQLTLEQQHITNAASLPAMIAQVESEIAECRRFSDGWKAIAPESGRLAELYRQITAEAALAKVALVNLRPGLPTTYQLIQEVPLELNLEGELYPLSAFLRALEAMPTSLQVRQVKLQPTSEDGQTLRCELNVSIFTENTGFSD